MSISSEDVIWHWLREGWKYRRLNQLSKAKQKEYTERIKYEMSLIKSKDFIDYFLMLSDIIRRIKDMGVPVGPARGSAAASLVCYVLRITEVDPMPFPLMLFERFMDPNRMDMPDIDIDFDDELRDLVRQEMIKKYGVDRVGNIGTFQRYRGKNSIDDVARVFEIPKFETEKVKEFLVERSGGDSRFDAGIEDTVEMFPQAKEVFDKYPDLYKSMQLEGNLKGFGVHAAGIVVGTDDLTKYVATYSREVGKQRNQMQVLSVDKKDGEYLGLMKVDALGLTTMGMLRHCLEIVGKPLEFLYEIPLEDPDVIKAFEAGDVQGIFQFEGRTAKMVTQEMKPASFMDLAAINALARPGPLHSGSSGEYLAIRHGRKERVDIHPLLTQICEDTEGQIIYQEQILKICGDIGDLSWTHRNAIRRVISNRKGESAFNALWEEFRLGAERKGVDPDVAKEIWKRMVTAGTYAFNVAHCISYSMLGVWAMYFKVHHPLAFYAAQLRKAPKEKTLPLLRDMQDARFGRNIQVMPPHPATSGITWEPDPEHNAVRAGFSQIPGVGPVMAETIMKHRDDFGLETWDDLLAVKGVGPKTLDKILEWVDSEDPFGINWVKNARKGIVDAIEDLELTLPMPDTTADQVPYEDVASRHVILGVLKNRNLQDLFENHRSRTGEELNPEEVKDPHLKDSMTLYLEDHTGLLTVKVNRWKYPELKDQLWNAKIEHDFILAKVSKKEFFGKTVHVNQMWIIDPD